MYSVLRTRTAVLEHVWRSFARSGVHWPTNPRVIVTLTLLKVGCNLWGYILSYRHLIKRISRWLKQFKTNSRHNSRLNSRTNCCSRPPGRALLLWRNSRVCSAGVYPEGFTKENCKQALRKRSKFFLFYSDVNITLL